MGELKTDQFAASLKKSIASGEYSPGCLLPPERDLALKSGVSRITVRAALAKLEKEGLISKLRGKGSQVKPRSSAKPSLAASTTHFAYVARHWPNVEDLSTMAFVKELSALLARQGKGLRLSPMLPGSGLDEFMGGRNPSEFIGGVIALVQSASPQSIELLSEAGVPCVSLGRLSGGLSIPYVESDHRQGVLEAVRHLAVEHGHRRIAFIGGPLEGFPMAELQFEGYRQALELCGLRFDPSLAKNAPMWSEKAGYEACESLFSEGSGCTAILSSGAEATLGAMACLSRRGLRTPEDVAVVMCSTSPWFEGRFDAPMTVVRESIASLSWNLLDLLDKVREGVAGSGSSRILSLELVKRRSCGCRF